MPTTNSQYLNKQGPELFRSHTSRWYASRENKLLLAIDEALFNFVIVPEHDISKRLNKISELLQKINQWELSKRDKVRSMKNSFRMPVVAALRDQARSLEQVLLMQLRKQQQLIKDQQVHAQKMQQQQKEREMHQRAQANWQKVATLQKPMVQTLQPFTVEALRKEGHKVNTLVTSGAANYMLEAADPEHHMGKEISDLYKKSGKTSFQEFLNTMDPATRDKYESSKVHYLDDLVIRTLFEVDFDNNCLYSRMTPDLQREVMSGTKSRQELFAIAKTSHPLNTTDWPSTALINVGSGWACFVMSMYNVVYVGVHMGGAFHHSSFLCGAPVLAAGMIRVENGRVIGIHEKNGHYASNPENMIQFIRLLERLTNRNMDDVEYVNHVGRPTKVSEIKQNIKDSEESKKRRALAALQPQVNQNRPLFPPSTPRSMPVVSGAVLTAANMVDDYHTSKQNA